MPVYNDEEYLEESISTIVNQSLKDVELICINDGSTDRSLEILEELQDKYGFIRIISQKNQGSGKARNAGIDLAEGEYIAFLDSDDRFIDSNALESMYDVAVLHDANMVSANLKGITVKNKLVNNNDGVERFVKEGVIKGSDYGIPYAFYKNIFKTSFIKEHNFKFPDLKRGQDPVFLSEIITKVDEIPILPIDLYGFRYAPTGGLSKINTFEKKWDYIKHFRETFDILCAAGFNDIFEEYKKKLFLFINHAQNSSDRVIFNIVHNIFLNDPDILAECDKYFKIESYESISKKIVFSRVNNNASSTIVSNLSNYITDLQKHYENENPFLIFNKIDELIGKYDFCRIDVKNIGDETNSLKVLNSNDPNLYMDNPPWFLDSNGVGSVFESSNGNLSLKLSCVGDGQLVIKFRGVDYRDYNNSRLPIFVEYEYIKINDIIIATNILLSHDKLLKHFMDVKDGEEINIFIKWKRITSHSDLMDSLIHSNNVLFDDNVKLTEKLNLINSFKTNEEIILNKNKDLSNEVNDLRAEIISLDNSNENLVNSEYGSGFKLDFYKKGYEFYKDRYKRLAEDNYESNILFNRVFNNQFDELYNRFEASKEEISLIGRYELQSYNIAYVLYGFPTLSETFIINELRWLKENNFNVKVFSYRNPAKPIDLDFDIETYRFDTDGNLAQNLENLLIEHNIDLIHTHFVYPTATKFTFPIAKKLNIPFTVFAHAFDIFIRENDKQNNISEIANSNLCKAVFTLSNYHKNYLIKRDVPESKIVLTRQATEYDIQPLIKKDNQIKKIVSISRFVEKKGLDILIETAKLLEDEDYEFSIYGFGNLEKDLQKQIDEYGLKNIAIKGSLPNSEEVKKVLIDSDLLVSPCRIARDGDRDGVPTVLFEAMGYGVPILTTNVSAIPEFVHDGENGFITIPDNPSLLADKIKEISSLSSEKLFEIRKNAQKDVQNISSIDKTLNNLLDTWGNF
jgi:glycosyltransferase involved in cell wall biosynthesis